MPISFIVPSFVGSVSMAAAKGVQKTTLTRRAGQSDVRFNISKEMHPIIDYHQKEILVALSRPIEALRGSLHPQKPDGAEAPLGRAALAQPGFISWVAHYRLPTP